MNQNQTNNESTNEPTNQPTTLTAHDSYHYYRRYPSEGIHRRWDAGFRITAVGATPDQTAVVLSAPRRAADAHEVQETLRTSAFPGEHVKAKWAGDLYLGARGGVYVEGRFRFRNCLAGDSAPPRRRAADRPLFRLLRARAAGIAYGRTVS